MENLSVISLDSKEIFEISGGARPGPAYAYGVLHAAVDFYNGFMSVWK